MCTLTWVHTARSESNETRGYHIHFNRDESRLRSTALPPRTLSIGNTRYIAPVDQDAYGTWIVTNDQGFSVCLLNNYIDVHGTLATRSRGLLVRDLAQAKNIPSALQLIDTDIIDDYAPFDLYLFDFNGTYSISWNGKQRSDLADPEPFKSSSGFNTEEVIRRRQQNYLHTDKTPEGLREFHRAHAPNKSAYSVCMHRHDARTQSYTEVAVQSHMASMRYCDGPPCSGTLSKPVSIAVL